MKAKHSPAKKAGKNRGSKVIPRSKTFDQLNKRKKVKLPNLKVKVGIPAGLAVNEARKNPKYFFDK